MNKQRNAAPRVWLGLVAAAAYLCCATAARAVTLVENGKAACTIVVGTEDRGCWALSKKWSDVTHTRRVSVLREAAEDMADHLNEMGWLSQEADRVRVVDGKARVRTKWRILLGSAAVEEHGLQEEAATLSYAGYAYRVAGDDLLIFGSSSKGAANGVYGFLQDELGVRWFGPQEVFRVVPRRDAVVLAELDKRVEPSFPGRLFHVAGDTQHPTYVWARRRLRMGEAVDDREPFINNSHYLYRIFRPAVYAEEHPEYYPVRNGDRLRPGVCDWTPCLTNPEVEDVAVRAALGFFRPDPRRHSFSLGINDTGAFCECAECQSCHSGLTFRGASTWQSDVYYRFVNRAARRVAREFPGRYIGCIAYSLVTPPPAGPVEKNVHVVVVNDVSEYFDRDYRRLDEELVRGWEKKGITLGLYYYMGLAKLAPAYFPRLVAEELRDKHRRGFTSLTCEVNPGWPWNGPMAYVAARLWWDLTLDVDDLLDEYFTTLYGPAAAPMSKLFALFEEIHMRPRKGGFLYEHYKLEQFRPYTEQDLVTMRRCLAEAHLAVPDGPAAQRVAYVSNGTRMFMDMLEAYAKASRLAQPQALSDVTVLEHLHEVNRLQAIIDNHDALYRETITSDRTQSRRYTRDTCKPVRRNWKIMVSSAVGECLVALHRWGERAAAADLVKVRLAETVARYTADPYRKAMFQLRAGVAELGPNLVSNPGFELQTGGRPHPVGPEWVASAADGWSLWPERNKLGFDVAATDRHGGERSARLHRVAEGTWITIVPDVKAGQLYRVTAWAKCLAPSQGELKSRVRLDVRWFNDRGGWWRFGANTYHADLGEADRWSELETIVLVPDGPAAAVLLLSASGLDSGQAAFFDDVSFREVRLK